MLDEYLISTAATTSTIDGSSDMNIRSQGDNILSTSAFSGIRFEY